MCLQALRHSANVIILREMLSMHNFNIGSNGVADSSKSGGGGGGGGECCRETLATNYWM